ncbi:GntR family transcriptional regulator [Faecalicatena sp. AGMB00832]|uniref:GntR family transcriptional regulator n=1 Tax=Faecalicatena faecalis TaxID=2726362 RepID=A0ABS6D4C4_9FIRM|nr:MULTISPECIES: GntR family transcriptional regulator [Faecalicatena]MBU3876338.1 GntR family transcriptional regulator [Faecalicatena faecalis]MCI6466465.1 GntR family transcriptional regulator [Faecalicatena sp.]MDY5618429.1 GntR family transcriptional regulator [Lachnospiraceae bacterium]
MGEYQDNSLSSRVFQRIRDDILKGKYKEHDELRENTIGKELGVSRTPVREALRQLELEGLVSIIPNKGAYVTGISPKDVSDIYMIRSMLEGLCARWATENISDEQLDELDEIMLLSEFHMKREGGGSAEQMAELDSRFHAVLYEASNSRILSHLLLDFHKYVQVARETSVVSEDRARKSIREHKQLLRAIRDKDADLAEQLANEHILHVILNLRKQGYEEI